MFIFYIILFFVICFIPIPFQILILIGDALVTGPGISSLVILGSIIVRVKVKLED